MKMQKYFKLKWRRDGSLLEAPFPPISATLLNETIRNKMSNNERILKLLAKCHQVKRLVV
jgi:hypothetical protein